VKGRSGGDSSSMPSARASAPRRSRRRSAPSS
jgi:hypothetical protein